MHISGSEDGNQGIAVIGISGRFPGANSVDELWANLLAGKDCIDKPPKDRNYLRGDRETEGGYLKCRLDEFDGAFFNLSPKECPFIDPQQRLFLEVSWESLEDAGIPPSSLVGSATGVFLGINNHEYSSNMGPPVDKKDYIYELMGTTWSGATGRFSHFLGLCGPSLAVESTCASAAVAIHTACQSLRKGESNLALAGGVNVLLEQPQKFPPTVLSSRCKTFDERANGFVPAEGCGVLVLKRVDDAVRDGDNILGIIRGSAVAHDGKTRGLGTPNPVVQAKVISEAMKMAGVRPTDISYVELHGTGTRVGDVAEIQSLIQVFGDTSAIRKTPLILGATKTNIGHSLAASGSLSLIKLLCCLKHRTVPKVIQFQKLNPRIDLEKIAGFIPLENFALEGINGGPILASLNTFGITGTVVHMIIEEAPPKAIQKTIQLKELPSYLVNISAKTPEALRALCNEYQNFAASNEINFQDFVNSVNLTRDQFSHRISITCKNKENFLEKLAQNNYGEGSVSVTDKLVFLFTGHGSQYAGMGKVLYESSPIFQTAFDKCAESFESHFKTCLKTYLWSEEEDYVKNNKNRMENPLLSQPATFCLQISLLHLWTKGFGLKPDAVLGHSFGEYAAAVAAEVLTFEDAMNLVCWRSALINEVPEGAMLAVSAPVETITSLIESFSKLYPGSWIDIAAINSESETVVSSTIGNICTFTEYCESLKLKTKKLRSQHAFHSRAMNPILNEFEKFAASISVQDPTCTYVSSVKGCTLVSKEEFSSKYWSDHLRNTVQYAKAIGTLLQDQCSHFIEIGPHPVLCNLTLSNKSSESDNELVLCPSLRRSENDWSVLLGSLGKLYVSWGGSIDWKGLGGARYQKLSLPHYPFQRKRHWMTETRSENQLEQLLHPLLGQKLNLPNTSVQWFTNTLSTSSASYLADHVVLDQVVLPGAGYLETMLGYGQKVLNTPLTSLVAEDLKFHSPLILTEETLKYNTLVSENQEIEIFTQKNGQNWTKHCTGKLYKQHNAETIPELEQFTEAKVIAPTTVYEAFQKSGITMGPEFQTLSEIQLISGLEMRCKVSRIITGNYVVNPCLLDAMIQAVWFFKVEQNSDSNLPLTVPKGIERVTFWDMASEGTDFTIRVLAEGDSVVLYNNGQAYIKMEGVTLAQATRNSFKTKIQAHPDIYHEKWIKIQTSATERCEMKTIPAIKKDSHWIKSLENTVGKARTEFKDSDTRIQHLSYLHVLKTFYTLGWSPSINDKVSAEFIVRNLLNSKSNEYLKTVHRFLVILEEEGVLERAAGKNHGYNVNDTWRVALQPPSLEKVELLLKSVPEHVDQDNIEYRFLTHCGQGLVDVFKGEISPLQLLFANPSANASLLYQHGHMFTLDTKTLAKLLEGVISSVNTTGSVLRILEIGAGTGATTREVLGKLTTLKIPFEYTFTDIGSTFLSEAQRKFEVYKDKIVYRTLDIEKDPRDQGFCPEAYDLILAANVLHATQDLGVTLKHVRQMLCPSGYLFVTELMKKYRLCDLSFGLLEGWWKFNDFREADLHPLIDFQAWEKILLESGFGESVGINNSGCFVTRSTSTSVAPVSNVRKTWILYNHDSGFEGDLLEDQLKDMNVNTIEVRPYCENRTSLVVRPGEYADFEKLADLLNPESVEGVIFLVSSNDRLEAVPNTEKQALAVSGFIHLLRLNVLRLTSQRVVLVTRGTKCVTKTGQNAISPLNGILYGILNSFMNEHPEFQCSTVDLDPLNLDPVTSVSQIISQLWLTQLPRTVAFRGTEAWVPRLTHVPQITQDNDLTLPSNGTFQIIEDFQILKTQLDSADIQVTVVAVGLNFRDILLANNLLPEVPRHYGFEFAGVISNIGTCKMFKVGDRVMGATNGGSMGNTINIINEHLLMKLPESMSFKEAATIPIAYGTAYYSLVNVAQLKQGEKVLIHTGSGGLGLAAIQVSQYLGCEVFVTAGSEKKRNFLRNTLGLTHVYDSRNHAAFLEGILRDTKGLGVDVVLNTLTGPGFIEASLKALTKSRGRFVELSKLNIWTSEEVKKLRPRAEYSTVDIAEMIQSRSTVLHETLTALEKLFETRALKSLTYTTYALAQLKQGFKYLQSSQHIGKIVIAVKSNTLFDSESTYIITGGLGGLGLRVCDWILERGGRNVVLVGRKSPTVEADISLTALRAKGNISVLQADISDYAQCKSLVDHVAGTPWPLQGIFHSAGVLADAVVVNQRWTNFQTVFGPKVNGSWNLHELTKSLNLDYFVLFSSIAAVVGTPGQSSHAAANSFMDALAHHRVEECGLKALSINWGAWGQIGAAAKLSGGLYDKVHHFSPEQGIAGLEAALSLGQAQVCIADIDSDIGTTILPKLKDYLSELEKPSNTKSSKGLLKTNTVSRASNTNFETLAEQIKKANTSGENTLSRIETLVEFTLRFYSGNTGESGELDRSCSMNVLGMDSLMGMEVRSKLSKVLGLNITMSAFQAHNSIRALSTHIQDLIREP